jgi:hypothetical protein
MSEHALSTPVAFFVFNRPDTTERAFAAIRAARPAKLLIVADGPRTNRPGEAERCAATRAIAEQVDWNCELVTHYAAENMGCRRRISSGLQWVFEQVPEAIILEDDCVPSASFFPYCAELLERYREDPRIFLISGNNFLGAKSRKRDSYYFTKYPYMWGWASWRRAMALYDVDVKGYPAFRASGDLARVCDIPGERRFWGSRFAQAHAGTADTWDYQVVYTVWRHGMLCIAPEKNLVSNIGFVEGATHLALGDDETSDLPVEEMASLTHPQYVERDLWAESYVFKRIYQGVWRRVALHLEKGYRRGGVRGLRDATVDLVQRTMKLASNRLRSTPWI